MLYTYLSNGTTWYNVVSSVVGRMGYCSHNPSTTKDDDGLHFVSTHPTDIYMAQSSPRAPVALSHFTLFSIGHTSAHGKQLAAFSEKRDCHVALRLAMTGTCGARASLRQPKKSS